MTEPTRLTAKSPADLLALIPHRLGFHPADSLVFVALQNRVLGFTGRMDLSTNPNSVAHLGRVLEEQLVMDVVLVTYAADDDPRHQPMMDAMLRLCASLGITVREAVRTNGSRFFSYTCAGSCCPPEGVPYDLTGSALSAGLVTRGSAPLPSRQALADSLTPLPDTDRVAVAMGDHLDHLGTHMPPEQDRTLFLRRSVRTLVDTLVTEQRVPTVEEVAQLALYTQNIAARDVAWSLMGTRDTVTPHLNLWRETLRRTPEPFVTPVATLTAFAAWLSGDGALADVALERVTEPYSMANLVRQALSMGMNPQMWSPAVEALEGTES